MITAFFIVGVVGLFALFTQNGTVFIACLAIQFILLCLKYAP